MYLRFASYRLYGLSYSMLYGMPVANALIGVYTVYYAIKNKLLYIILAFVILFSSVINARISIVPIALGLLYIIFVINHERIVGKKITRVLSITILIILALYVFSYVISSNLVLSGWISKGTKDIIAILFRTDNGSSYYSYYTGSEKWQLPSNFVDIIIGTGNRVIRGNSNYSSDIGYINDIWWGGLIYCVFAYFYLIGQIHVITKYRNNKGLIFIDIVLITILAIVNIKGNVIGLNEIMGLITILFVNSCVKNKESNSTI